MPTHLKPILAFLFLLALCITVSLTPLTSHRPAPPRSIDELVSRALANAFKHGLAFEPPHTMNYYSALYAAARRTVPTDNASARHLIDLFAAEPNWFKQAIIHDRPNEHLAITQYLAENLIANAAEQPTDDQLIYALQRLPPYWGYKAPEGCLIESPNLFATTHPSPSTNRARRLALLPHIASTTTNPEIAKAMNDATKRVISYAQAHGARVTTLEETIQAAADWEANLYFLMEFQLGDGMEWNENLWRSPPKREPL